MAWKALASKVSGTRPSVPLGRRVYAVGDIHGRADLLAAVFRRIDHDLKARPAAKTVQVFLGDYIDRGPHSRQVIDLLLARQREHEVELLKGNHEACAVQFLSDPTVLSQWRLIGGVNTLLSYGVIPKGRNNPQSQQEVALPFASPSRTAIAGLSRVSSSRLPAETSFLFMPACDPERRCKSKWSMTYFGSGKTFCCTKSRLVRLSSMVIRPHASQMSGRTASISIPARMRLAN